MTAPGATAVATPALDAASAMARVQQLEQMIAASRDPGATQPASASSASSGGFAAALASASAAPAATSTGPAASSAAAPYSADSGSAASPSAYDALISNAALRNGVDPALLHGLIQQESGFDPNSRSSAGALGLTQLMPENIAALGVTNPFDPAQSIDAGARLLRQQLDAFGGDVVKALAAYNAGPNAVRQYGGVPPYAETQDYVRKVLGYAGAWRAQTGAVPSTLASASTFASPAAA